MAPMPMPETVLDIWGAAENDLWAVGKSGFGSHWDGETWTLHDIAGRDIDLYSLWGFAANDIYAVGGATLAHWDGSEWTLDTIPTTYYMLAIWGAAPSDLFAVGAGGTIMHWDGTDWSSMVSNTSEQLTGVWGAASDDVYAAGRSGTIVHWNGEDWVPAVSGTTEHLSKIMGIDADTIYAAGNHSTVLYWNGDFWGSLPDPGLNSLEGIWISGAGEVYVAGMDGVFRWDGASWETCLAEETIFGPACLWGFDAETVFAGGSGRPEYVGRVYRMEDDIWTSISTGAAVGWLSVHGTSDTDIYFAGGNGTVQHWDGSGFETVLELPSVGYFRGVWCAGENDVYVAGESGNAAYWNGSDWTHWTSSQTGTDSTLTDVWADSSTDVFVTGSSGLILHWDGSQWESMASGTNDFLIAVWGSGPDDVYAVGGENNPGHGIFHGSIHHYDGSGWTRVYYIENTLLNDIWGSGDSDVYVVGDAGVMLHWDGAVWQSLDVGVHESMYFIYGASPHDIVVIGYENILVKNGPFWSASPRDTYWLGPVWGTGAGEYYSVNNGGRISCWNGAPDTGVRIEIPDVVISPGDEFHVTGILCNAGADQMDLPVFFMLDIAGEFWFWDDWTYYSPVSGGDIDYRVMDVPSGQTPVEVIPSFTWPDTGSDQMTGLRFWGAMLTPDMSAIFGDIDVVEWGFGP